jgi:osmotically-inducible protein OsmY
MKRLLGLVGGGALAAGWLLGFFFDKDNGRRRRKGAIDRTAGFFRRRARDAGRAGRAVAAETYGVAMKATHLREQRKPQPDDVTLARKVETEIFRPADVPKGRINVNAEDGVVYLRGEADTPEMINELVERARKVQGVTEVENLLHLPKTPAPMKE